VVGGCGGIPGQLLQRGEQFFPGERLDQIGACPIQIRRLPMSGAVMACDENDRGFTPRLPQSLKALEPIFVSEFDIEDEAEKGGGMWRFGDGRSILHGKHFIPGKTQDPSQGFSKPMIIFHQEQWRDC